MKRTHVSLLLAVVFSLMPACRDQGHSHDQPGGHSHGGQAASGERPTVAVTRWTDRTELFMELSAPGRAAEVIDRTVSCGGNDPPGRVGWDAVALPAVTCHDERTLDGVFGKRDVAVEANQRCHRLAVHLTEHQLNICRFPVGGDGRGHA